MSNFLPHDDINNNAKAIAIPRVFSENSRAKKTLRIQVFESNMRIGENAGNQHFLFFPWCFQNFPRQISLFKPHSICPQQMPLIGPSKILINYFLKKAYSRQPRFHVLQL